MIRTARLIFCENEHGTGDVTFPDLDHGEGNVSDHFINSLRVADLRKAAKQAGWGRVNGADYCPMCMEGGV